MRLAVLIFKQQLSFFTLPWRGRVERMSESEMLVGVG
jgi:hypothetical protein